MCLFFLVELLFHCHKLPSAIQLDLEGSKGNCSKSTKVTGCFKQVGVTGGSPELQKERLGVQIKHKWERSDSSTGGNGDLAGLAVPGPKVLCGFTVFVPSFALPKTTCWPPSRSVVAVPMEPWEPFAWGPAFAVDKRPGPVCFRMRFSPSHFSS